MKPGYYKIELNKTTWEVPETYANLTPIGTGAYGSVCAADNTLTGEKVAMKKFSRPFQSAIHAKRMFRELTLLRHMDHENVIDLLDVFTPDTSAEEISDVYMVSTLMGADLSNIIKIQRLTDDHIQFLVYQVLRGLKYIHSAGVIHRDLKPSNIAVNEDCELKILDFGLARQSDDEMTGYVATRWYRAPEIMLNWMHYNNTDIDQLQRIMNVVGTPKSELLDKIQSEEARNYIRSLEQVERKNFTQFFANATPEAVDLLEKMLDLDPQRRPSATECLEHAYMSTYHDPDDEPEAPPVGDLDSLPDTDVPGWQKIIWDEIEDFEKQQSAKCESMEANGDEASSEDLL